MAADPSKVARAKALLAKFDPWFSKYRGGMTKGMLASFMLHESNGDFSAPGDTSLGEVGFFQVAAYVPPLFGLPAEARFNPETNVALAVLEYSLEAALFFLRYPNYVRLGTQDSWMLARLAFAVGRGGSYQLADRAAVIAKPGNLYGGILESVRSAGAPSLGSQSAAKVVARVASIPDQFAIANAVDSWGMGRPTRIPDPPAGRYTLPATVAPLFMDPIPLGPLLLLGAGGIVLYFAWRS